MVETCLLKDHRWVSRTRAVRATRDHCAPPSRARCACFPFWGERERERERPRPAIVVARAQTASSPSKSDDARSAWQQRAGVTTKAGRALISTRSLGRFRADSDFGQCSEIPRIARTRSTRRWASSDTFQPLANTNRTREECEKRASQVLVPGKHLVKVEAKVQPSRASKKDRDARR